MVTSFEFLLHPVGPSVLSGAILWDAGDNEEARSADVPDADDLRQQRRDRPAA